MHTPESYKTENIERIAFQLISAYNLKDALFYKSTFFSFCLFVCLQGRTE